MKKLTEDLSQILQENVKYRASLLEKAESDEVLRLDLLELCAKDILFFVDNFLWTKDPRLVESQKRIMPFVCYPFQRGLILQIERSINTQQDLLVDKSRDMGVTWAIMYVILHQWLFIPGADFRVGSRKEEFVDKLGDIDTLFEKLRFAIQRLPRWVLPKGFDLSRKEHSTYMKLINPETGSAVIGESANEDFGSGGRRRAIFMDEFSKWEERVAESAWTACYSKDTEVLTGGGWRLIKDVKKGDLVYSVDPRTKTACLMPVTETYKYYFNDMIEFKSRSLDLLVTENHQMLYETRKGKYLFRDAKSLIDLTNGRIPLTSKYIGGKAPSNIYGFSSGDWMEFLGWYISEGSTSKSGTVLITQSETANPLKVQMINQLLDRMGLQYSRNGHKDFNISAKGFTEEARCELKSLGKCDTKYVPRKYLNMNKPALIRLWDGLRNGDGWDCYRKGRVNATGYTTTSKQLADDVQEIAQKIGYRASISSREVTATHIMGRRFKSKPKRRYDVYFGYSKGVDIGKLVGKYVTYGDNVYCVTTKFHTLYVRRNGLASWCGNTADVTNCRIVCSTPKGSANKFAQLAHGTEEKIRKVSVHWTLHPKKVAGAYYMDGEKRIQIEDLDRAFDIWKSGREVRSPWYDGECERRTEADVAQELDINYLKSGSPYFNIERLRKQKVWKKLKRSTPSDDVPYGYYIEAILRENLSEIRMVEQEDGWLRIYQLPEAGQEYVVAADIAEGLEKHDQTAGGVRSKYTGHLMADFAGSFDPTETPYMLKMLSKYYNEAEIAPENNNHGYSVCKDLEDMGARLYYTTRPGRPGEQNIQTRKRGFTTNSQTRPMILDNMKVDVEKNGAEVRSPVILAQMETFVRSRTGKPQAEGRFLDDGVMWFAICGWVIREKPQLTTQTKSEAVRDSKIQHLIQRKKNGGFSYKAR